MTEEWLQKNALWIIMDPWYPHPYKHDQILNHDINLQIDNVVDQIVNYLPKVKHVVTSMKLKVNNCNVSVHSKLRHYYNIHNKMPYTIHYLKKHNLQNIVYCGFHYGRCILNNKNGAKQMSKYFKTWVKKDLCGFFNSSTIPSIEYADQLTLQYATIF